MSLTFPRRPAVPLALAAISGAAVGPLLPEPLLWLLASLALPALWRWRRSGVPLALTLIGLGGLYGLLAAQPPSSPRLSGPCEGPVRIEGVLVGDPESGRSLGLEVDGALLPLRIPRSASVSGAPTAGARLAVVGRISKGRLRAAEIQELSAGRGIGALLASWRRHARSLIRRGTSGSARGLMRAVLLGERGGLPSHLRAAFVRTGSVHLLCISGLHAGLLLSGLLGLLSLAHLRPSELRWTGVAAVVLLVALVGARAPILRAGVAASIFLLLPGRGDGWNRLSVALLVVLAWDPQALRSVGFQLSFGTVAGILALGPPLVTWAGGKRHPLRSALAGALACFLASTPLLGLTLDTLPLAALPLGLPSTLLFALVLGLGAAGLAVGALVPVLGEQLLAAGGALADVLFTLVEAAARLPGASIPLRAGSPALGVLALGLLAIGCVRRDSGRKGGVAAVAGLALLVAVLAGLDR